jgi:hypothetical protein
MMRPTRAASQAPIAQSILSDASGKTQEINDMPALELTSSVTLRPLAGDQSRYVVLSGGHDKWAIACHANGSLVVALAHSNKEWIYEQAEAWLAGAKEH